MQKEKEINKRKAYLCTSLTLLSNALYLEPEKIGSIIAECSIEACKGIFGTSNGKSRRVTNDWIEKLERSFSEKLCELIENDC